MFVHCHLILLSEFDIHFNQLLGPDGKAKRGPAHHTLVMGAGDSIQVKNQVGVCYGIISITCIICLTFTWNYSYNDMFKILSKHILVLTDKILSFFALVVFVTF